MPRPTPFAPALLIVDLQEDFCPPSGALPVPEARSVIPPTNALLTLPFVVRLATKDWHPRGHVSFAANHPPPNNTPFQSTTAVRHPDNPGRAYETRLWPVHCVQNTPGAELVPGLEAHLLDGVVEKGQDERVEMYSAFTDPFHDGPTPWAADSASVSTSELARLLREKGVTDVYVAGLAMDYCVKETAVHAVKYGFRTYVVKEATRAVAGEEGEKSSAAEMEKEGVKVVSFDGEEIGWLREGEMG